MNKKLILITLCALVFSACQNTKLIQFDVTVSGLSTGVFAIKNQGQQVVFGENIKNGKCSINKQLDEPGFYLLDISRDGEKEHLPFEVYLEPSTYTVTADASDFDKYPKIITDCKKQQEINNYNALNDEMGIDVERKTAKLNKEMNEKGKSLSQKAFQDLANKLAAAEDEERDIQFVILEAFVKKYPGSELSAHFMAKQNYNNSPKKYSELFAKLSPVAKSSDEGKDLSVALTSALKVQPGQKAPDIAGKTPAGKTFAEITAGKKLILVDFWRSINQVSRLNHDNIKGVYSDWSDKGFEVISVSLDKRDLWWKTAIKDDKLPWPQLTDLKGDDSPNRTNWNINELPTYYLIDAKGNIYKKDVPLAEIRTDVSEYFDKNK